MSEYGMHDPSHLAALRSVTGYLAIVDPLSDEEAADRGKCAA
jgi:hypothetical protein